MTLLQGTVKIHPGSSPINVGIVVVKLSCDASSDYVIVNFREDLREYEFKSMNIVYSPDVYFSLLDVRGSGGRLLSSPLEQPIAFSIPLKDLLSSVNVRGGNKPSSLCENKIFPLNLRVNHSMTVTVYGMDNNVIVDKTVDVNMRPVFNYPDPEKPLKVTQGQYGFSCCSLNKITFHCATDRTVYGPGDDIRLSCWFTIKNAIEEPPAFCFAASLETTVSGCTTNASDCTGSHTRVLAEGVSTSYTEVNQIAHLVLEVPADVTPEFNAK